MWILIQNEVFDKPKEISQTGEAYSDCPVETTSSRHNEGPLIPLGAMLSVVFNRVQGEGLEWIPNDAERRQPLGRLYA